MDLHDGESGSKGASEPVGGVVLAGTCSDLMCGWVQGEWTRSTASLPLDRWVGTRCRASVNESCPAPHRWEQAGEILK